MLVSHYHAQYCTGKRVFIICSNGSLPLYFLRTRITKPMSEVKVATLNIVIVFRADAFSLLLHQGAKISVEGVLRCTKPTSPGGICMFLSTFPCTGDFKQAAEHLTDKQVLLSSWSASLQPTAEALEWQCRNRLNWHFFRHLSFPANAAKQLRWPSAGNLWMEVILWLNKTRFRGILNNLLQNTFLFLDSLYYRRNKLPNAGTRNTSTMVPGDQRHLE